ncbi:MAG: YdcF family protein [Deltaproteobacteria bacterium]|nr:YdcF family protein [Deltaproteobacteria bacterium]
MAKPITIGAAAVLVSTGYGIFANGYVIFKTRHLLFSDVTHVPQRDVAIVPGAKVYSDGTPSRVLKDRLRAAMVLYQAKKVKKIIVSGDHMAPEYNEPGAMAAFLVEMGIPQSDVIEDHAGFRTLDTMARASKVFGIRSAVICTQRFHLARSVYLAVNFGVNAIGYEADLTWYRGHILNHFREFAARSFALLDVHVLHAQPRFPGPSIRVF